MDLNKSTQKAQEAIYASQQLARDFGHQTIEPAHLLLALIQQNEGVVPAVITKVAGNTQALFQDVKKELESQPKVSGWSGDIGISQPTAKVLEAAQRFAKGMQDEYTSTEHILLGLLESSESKRLEHYGLTKDNVLKALVDIRGNQRVTSANPESTYQALEKYGRDLTAMARQGKLDPVIGRDEEIRRLIQILSAGQRTIQP